MKAINRLNEAKISKYDKYINKLVNGTNERLKINLRPDISADPYTYRFKSFVNQDKEFLIVILDLTTNRIGLEGIMWGTFYIAGRKYEIGELFGDLNTDLDILEDSYYDFFETLERTHEKITAIDLK